MSGPVEVDQREKQTELAASYPLQAERESTMPSIHFSQAVADIVTLGHAAV